MTRFFGMMPRDCVEISRCFKDSSDLDIRIEAGPEGWTIVWADHSSDYDDVKDTSENNFKKAYDKAVDAVGPLREVTHRIYSVSLCKNIERN